MHTSWIAKIALAICIGCLFSPSAMAAPNATIDSAEKIAAMQRDVAVIKETTTLRLEAQKESLQKELQNLQSKIEQQDKRVADIYASTDRFSALLTVFAVLAAALGVTTWFSAGAKAKAAAQDWIKTHEPELVAYMRENTDKVQAAAMKAHQIMQASRDEVATEAALRGQQHGLG